MDLVRLASGRDADVFALDERRVLRRYRDGGDVSPEVATMRYVGVLGYPVPVVHEAGGADLVMERLSGPTMAESLTDGLLDLVVAADQLADLHRRLHELPAAPGRPAGVRILHLDLHPGNVMLTERGPVVIDWRNASTGPPDLDVAVTALILAQVAVQESTELATAVTALLSAFLRAAGGHPLSALDRAVLMRRCDPTMTPEELTRLDSAADLVRRV